MKLTEQYFIPTITNEGVVELYDYTKAILLRAGKQIPRNQWDDVQQEMVLRCLEKLPSFKPEKGIPLGGYLYWQCRGAISIWANKHGREFAMPEDKLISLKRSRQLRGLD